MSRGPIAALRARLSLRGRVGLVLVLSFAAFEAGFLYLSFSSRASDLRHELFENGRTSLVLMERVIAEQALIGDYAAIQQSLELCTRTGEFRAVVFEDVSGKSLKAFSRQGPGPAPAWLQGLAQLDEGPIVVDVRLGGVRYGSLSLEMDPAPAEARLYQSSAAQGVVSAAFLVAILVLSWLPLRSNLSILLRLRQAAQRFESGDYGARVDFSPDHTPELRETAGAFNAMGGRIGGLLTALSEQNEALRESRHMLRLVLDNVPQLVFWKDRQSVYLGCNRNFSEAAGVGSPSGIGGKTDFDLPWKDTEAEAYRKDDREVMQTGKAKLKYIETQLMASGRLAYVETNKVPLQDADGNVVGILGTYEDITERRAVEKRIEYLAYYDGLTGLPNRTLLEDRLSQAIASAQRHGKPFAVLFLDLDGFKAVNDRLGHDRGDEFLKEMALRLGRAIRYGDTVARLGGDEFVLLLVDLGGREDAKVAIERVLDAIRAPVAFDGLPVSVTATVGVALYPADDLDGDVLLRHADIAMYQAKESGRDRYLFFDREMARATTAHDRERERIADAFRKGEFGLYYQPTVNMRTGAVVGVEALLRWHEVGRGVRIPGEFLPAIEETDLIVEIGEWVLNEALSRLESWGTNGLDLRVGVNVAARQIQHRGFLKTVQEAFERHPLASPQRLEIEILETTALDDVGVVQGVMAKCREMGIRFCLDDFGTGYSSLSYLKRLHVDVVKIDQSFVRGMLEDREDLAIIESILSMSAILGRQVVAEGVAGPEQGLMLLRLGCELAQGFGIGRPMPGEDVALWVKGWRPDPTWALLADTAWKVNDFSLMVAAQEHSMWVEQVLRSASGSEPPVKALAWNANCRLGRWLEGPGKEKYEQLPAFREAWHLHQEAHDVASRLGHAAGMEAAVAPLRDRLLTLRDGLLERLGSLDRAAVGS